MPVCGYCSEGIHCRDVFCLIVTVVLAISLNTVKPYFSRALYSQISRPWQGHENNGSQIFKISSCYFSAISASTCRTPVYYSVQQAKTWKL